MLGPSMLGWVDFSTVGLSFSVSAIVPINCAHAVSLLYIEFSFMLSTVSVTVFISAGTICLAPDLILSRYFVCLFYQVLWFNIHYIAIFTFDKKITIGKNKVKSYTSRHKIARFHGYKVNVFLENQGLEKELSSLTACGIGTSESFSRWQQRDKTVTGMGVVF